MLIITTRRRQRQREDEAWSEGANADQDEVEDFIAGKDDFIAKQSGIITGLVDVITAECPKLFESMPSHLYQQLRDYA